MLAVSPGLEPVCRALNDYLLVGGKRLRPAFCYWGFRGAGGTPDELGIIDAAAALELLHGCALIHDDVMDASDTRRGQPSMHRRFASWHSDSGMNGSPERFGTAVAILLGDMCLAWCDQMFDECTLPNVRAAKAFFHLMHTELVAGQYLDMLDQSLDTISVQRALNVIHYKTSRYSIERPLQLGAILAGASQDLLDTYASFAVPLGEAFQLRDDILGVFGDTRQTGKPSGDDLREGKHTVMIALATERSAAADRTDLGLLLGDPDISDDGIERLRSIIRRTGALDSVEQLISERRALALSILDAGQLADSARAALADLATAVTRRVS
jgi:geranylgeranyl diphosphate synthase, type I